MLPELKMLNQSKLQELLLQFRAGTLDHAGRSRLEKWADEADENRALLDLLADARLGRDRGMLYSYDEQRVWRNIRRAAASRRRRSVFGVVLRAATAAAVLVGGVLLVDGMYSRLSQPAGIVSVIEPGRTMAVLQLSSGERVELRDKAGEPIREADETEIVIDSASTKFSNKTYPQKNEPFFNTVTVPSGSEYQIELSDGTKVWLNAESEIIFPTRFDDDIRCVELRGEAYFEVKSNPKHPFIVKTERLEVEVLGTSFNIMTYADEAMVETTLISGSLKVRTDNAQTLLEPGMQAQFDRATMSLNVREVYAESYAAWSKQMFVFFDEPIESICRKLSRWYNVEIDASSKRLHGIRYSGMIRRAETLNGVAELLSSTDELHFREVNGRMIVDTK